MIDVRCPCGGEFVQVETDNSLTLTCLACAGDTSEARKHLRLEDQQRFTGALRRSTGLVRKGSLKDGEQ